MEEPGGEYRAEAFRYDLWGNRDGDGSGGQRGLLNTRPDPGNVAVLYGPNNAANQYDAVGGQVVPHDHAETRLGMNRGWVSSTILTTGWCWCWSWPDRVD